MCQGSIDEHAPSLRATILAQNRVIFSVFRKELPGDETYSAPALEELDKVLSPRGSEEPKKITNEILNRLELELEAVDRKKRGLPHTRDFVVNRARNPSQSEIYRPENIYNKEDLWSELISRELYRFAVENYSCQLCMH